jgi:hypothetical protein
MASHSLQRVGESFAPSLSSFLLLVPLHLVVLFICFLLWLSTSLVLLESFYKFLHQFIQVDSTFGFWCRWCCLRVLTSSYINSFICGFYLWLLALVLLDMLALTSFHCCVRAFASSYICHWCCCHYWVKFLQVLFSSSVNVFNLFAKFYFVFWQSIEFCIYSSPLSFRLWLHFVSVFVFNFVHGHFVFILLCCWSFKFQFVWWFFAYMCIVGLKFYIYIVPLLEVCFALCVHQAWSFKVLVYKFLTDEKLVHILDLFNSTKVPMTIIK